MRLIVQVLLVAFSRSHDQSPKSTNFLTKTAQTGSLDRTRRHDSGSCSSGFGEGRRATLHYGAGGREGRSQCWITVSVFPEQGGDPLPAPERRMAADDRLAAQHP